MIVVIAILAILAAILIPSLTQYLEKANTAKNEANARSLYSEYTLALNVTPKVDPANTIVATAAAADKCAITYNTGATGFADATSIVSITCGVSPSAGTFRP